MWDNLLKFKGSKLSRDAELNLAGPKTECHSATRAVTIMNCRGGNTRTGIMKIFIGVDAPPRQVYSGAKGLPSFFLVDCILEYPKQFIRHERHLPTCSLMD